MHPEYGTLVINGLIYVSFTTALKQSDLSKLGMIEAAISGNADFSVRRFRQTGYN